MRRMVESPSQGAQAALELIREEERNRQRKTREGITIGGLVNIGVGIGLALFFWGLDVPQLRFVGAIPGLIGIALLTYAFFFAPKAS